MADGEEKEEGTTTWDVLTVNEVKATFGHITEQKCMFRTALCPDRCNHGGEVAVFDVDEYIKYEKPGEHGDAKVSKYHVKLREAGEFEQLIRSLTPGDQVTLAWEHRYVTQTYPDGTSSKYPARPITALKKIG